MQCPHCGSDLNHVIEQRLQRVERQAADLDAVTAKVMARLEPARPHLTLIPDEHRSAGA